MGWAIALHGGAGDIARTVTSERMERAEAGLRHCLQIGVAALRESRSALDVAEIVVRELENDPTFNAGRGAVLTEAGTIEMEATIMDGSTKHCGAVSGLSTVVNPISLARLVMEKTPHIYLAFDGAEKFAREQGVDTTNMKHFITEENVERLRRARATNTVQVRELENNPSFNAGKGAVLTEEGTIEMEASIMEGSTKRCGAVSGLSTVVNPISLARLVMEKTPHIYLAFDGAEKFAREQGVDTTDTKNFITEESLEQLRQARETKTVQVDFPTPAERNCHPETVGCVVVDGFGNCVAATSTGGMVNKMVGRIGDTPLIGVGNYANHLCAVSATGRGEHIIRATVARDVAALMEYKGFSLKEAANYVIGNMENGTCGLVSVSCKGEVVMPFNTSGMFRACATEDGYSEVGILA